jgi:hypothetical protein
VFVVSTVEKDWLSLVETLDLSYPGRFIERSEIAARVIRRLLLGCNEVTALKLRVTSKNSQLVWAFLPGLRKMERMVLVIPWKSAATLELGLAREYEVPRVTDHRSADARPSELG